MTVIDVATAYIMLTLMSGGSSQCVIDALSGGWFRAFGPPVELYGDSDRAWMSASFQQWADVYGVPLSTSPAAAPTAALT